MLEPFPELLTPTPVRACLDLRTPHAELWLKNDGLSHPIYGGSKVRKAVVLLAEAKRRNARRVLSFGAVGSHHLLTLAIFARAAGLDNVALLIPQPRSQHALETLCTALGQGLHGVAVPYPPLLPQAFVRVVRRGDYVIAPGGSNVIGAESCANAIDELVEQIALGELPMPDWIVTPLGSGGTCGGLAAGVIRRGLPCRVLGVQVVGGPVPRAAARWLAREVLRRRGQAPLARSLSAQLAFDVTQVGPGYGFETGAGARASAVARQIGLDLDQTYTAKAFASALALLHGTSTFASTPAGRPLRVLYWHTLSATDRGPLLDAAVPAQALPASLSSLLR